ncbi:MAG: hypothetical protein J6A25_05805 [Lachnospiraceae bacterium]|nr:hypothetical protein [Lachnospiraceae bacterium]
MNLYVNWMTEVNDVNDFFYFYDSTKDLSEDTRDDRPFNPSPMSDACTVLVREKDGGSVGVLILLKKDIKISVLAHEAVHYVDALYDYLNLYSQGFDDPGGNEHYAYLVEWCVDQLEDFIEFKSKKNR